MSDKMRHIFTSESVSEGHPDKMADQISDAVLDAVLKDDPTGRVACEVLITTGICVVAGEITTTTYVDVPKLAREVIADIGFTDARMGFDAKTCGILNTIQSQSPDIAMGVDTGGAGDQGLMFGYACDETPELMPLPIMMAHKLVRQQSDVRRDGKLTYLRPDAKSQVSVEYVDGKPKRIDAVVLSTQHDDDVTTEQLRADVKKYIIDPVVGGNMVDSQTKYHINPTGRFVIGGPHGDTGLTGRKIIVDTYGGMGRHGLLHGTLRGQEHRSGGYGFARRSPVGIRDRRGRAGFHHGEHLRHGHGARRASGRDGSCDLYFDAEGNDRNPEAAPSDLPQDRCFRALRPHRRNLHVGSHRQGQSLERGVSLTGRGPLVAYRFVFRLRKACPGVPCCRRRRGERLQGIFI